MKKDIVARQEQVKGYIREYGLAASIEGTGLPLCDIRRTYTDEDPVYDHLVRVYQFYRGLEHEQTIRDNQYQTY